MRAKFEGVEMEGSPSEIAEFLKSMKDGVVTDAPEKKAGAQSICSESDREEPIPEQFAYRTLKRIPLSSMQKALLLFLRRNEHQWVLASSILGEFDWSGTQLGGVLGGLGRRLTATNGYKRGYELWNWKWSDDEGEYAYRLPQTVVAALDRLNP